MKKFLALLLTLMLMLTVSFALAEGTAASPNAFDWQELCSTLLYAIMAAAVPVLTNSLVKFVKAKRDQLTAKMTDEELKNGINEATDAVLTAVTVTNQTFVDSLKDKNMFDAQAQKDAFDKSWVMAKSLFTDAAKKALTTMYGGVEDWLNAKIEETTNALKRAKVEADPFADSDTPVQGL